MPRRALRERPDTMATGTARISGQGVATTRTARARTGSPDINHAIPAMTSVNGRKNMAYLSAIRTIGALDACACSTSLIIPAYTLSVALTLARILKGVCEAFTVPLNT